MNTGHGLYISFVTVPAQNTDHVSTCASTNETGGDGLQASILSSLAIFDAMVHKYHGAYSGKYIRWSAIDSEVPQRHGAGGTFTSYQYREICLDLPDEVSRRHPLLHGFCMYGPTLPGQLR